MILCEFVFSTLTDNRKPHAPYGRDSSICTRLVERFTLISRYAGFGLAKCGLASLMGTLDHDCERERSKRMGFPKFRKKSEKSEIFFRKQSERSSRMSDAKRGVMIKLSDEKPPTTCHCSTAVFCSKSLLVIYVHCEGLNLEMWQNCYMSYWGLLYN